MKWKFEKFLVACALCVSFAATAQTSEGEASSPFAQVQSGNRAQAPDALTATSAYYFVAASAFTARSSITSTSYSGGGCIKMNGPEQDGAINTDIQIPDGASIVGMRFFYADTTAFNLVNVYLLAFDGASNSVELVSGSSQAHVGYGNTYLALTTPFVVDNFAQSLAIQVVPMGTTPTFCGARVYYSVP